MVKAGARDQALAMQMAFVGDLFFVRWDGPSATSCADVRAAFEAGRSKKSPFCVAIFPADMAAPSERELGHLVDLTRGLMGVCAHLALVIEAPGPRGAALRSALSTVRSPSSRRYGVSVVSSVDRALSWAPGPLPDADVLRSVFETTDDARSPSRRVA